MLEFVAPSGATVVINPAPWKDAKALKKAIEREIAYGGEKTTLALVLGVDSSDAVDAALWPCLVRCTRDSMKIVESTFDDSAARTDYYDIVEACVKENLAPLAESLSSKLSSLGIIMKKAPVKEGLKSE